jgi:hypothetical protein
VRLPTQQSSRAQTHPRALHIRMSSFAITTPNLKARTKYTKCDSSACIRAPGNTHLPKLHYSMQGPTCSRRRRRLGGIQYACMQGSHGPVCKPFRADVPRFLDFTLRKVTGHFFRLLVLDFLDARLGRLGGFAGCGRPAGLFVYCAISIGTIVRFRSIYLQRGLVDVLAGPEHFGRNILPPPWGFCDDR